MPGFDVHDPALPLMEDHFIEASAGTGKTYTIEHLVLRFLQAGIPLDQILVVTFTKAATRELAARIRARIVKAGMTPKEEARIFTLHGFCFHTLQQFALETGFPLDREEESDGFEQMRQIAADTLRTMAIPSRQLDVLIRHYRGETQRLIDGLASTALRRLPIEGIRSFETIQAAYQVYPGMAEELEALAPHFKKGPLPTSLEELPPELLTFHPENQKKRSTAAYPDRLAKLMPLIEEMNDPLQIFARIAQEVMRRAEEVEDLFTYDDLLRTMEKETEQPAFAQKVRRLYKVVLIDEFQDTDPVQWNIFSRLFLGEVPLYLVGDPKQSIYRFRDADIYTYLTAKKQIQRHVSLERNYRSQPQLVDALNHLLTAIPDFFPLPKWGEALSCPPVLSDPEKTGVGTLHFWKGEKETDFYPAIVEEIVQSKLPLRECAVLVRDRHQAERIAQYCQQHNVPASVARTQPLNASPAVAVFEDLLASVRQPRRPGRALGSPLFGWDHTQILEQADAQVPLFLEWNALLEKEGMLALFYAVMEKQLPTLLTHPDGKWLYRDMAQLAAHGEPWPDTPAAQSQREEAVQILTIHMSKGLEFELVIPLGLISSTRVTRELVSTGSALVLSDTQPYLEELDAEKMRQFYVAVTRAKAHLRLPVLPPKARAVGAASPMELFLGKYPHVIDFTEMPKEARRYTPPQIALTPPQEKVRSDPPRTIASFSSLAIKEELAPPQLPEGDLPPGPETGRLLHECFEQLPFHPRQLRGTLLEPYTDRVAQIIETALHTPLLGPEGTFTLADVPRETWVTEMEFLYPSEQGYLKGYIDLFFAYRGYAYFLDWKSNLLNDYTQASMEEAMRAYDYHLQADIYREAVQKYLCLFNPQLSLGGMYYLFLRGLPEGVYLVELNKNKV